MPLIHPTRAVSGLMLAASLSGALSEDPRIHGILAIFYLSFIVLAMTVFAFGPERFSSP
jgi:hypothetical protein